MNIMFKLHCFMGKMRQKKEEVASLSPLIWGWGKKRK